MDLKVRQELNDILEKLTHSGNSSLDQNLMKKVKILCKSSDAAVVTVHDILLRLLAKDHAEVRLSAFQVCNDLFQRSHTFRELTTESFQKIIPLICGVESTEPLPPPKHAANRLKEHSLLAIKQWMEKFGEGYPKLKLGYQYLKYNKKVDFDSLVAASEGERRRREEHERRNRAFLQQRLQEVQEEMNEQLPEIHACVKEMESCFQILMPSFSVPEFMSSQTGSHSRRHRIQSESSDSFVSISEEEEEDGRSEGNEEDDKVEDVRCESEEKEDSKSDSYSVNHMTCGTESDSHSVNHMTCGTESDSHSVNHMTRGIESDSDSEVEWEEVGGEEGEFSAHGMIGTGWNVTVEVPGRVRVIKGEDNESLVDALRERYKLLVQKYLPNVLKWTEWFTKTGNEDSLKEAIDLKALLTATREKYNDLHILSKEEDRDEGTEEDSCSPVSISCSNTVYRDESGLFSCHDNTHDIQEELCFDPTTPQAQVAAMGTQKRTKLKTSKNTSSSAINHTIPVIPFDVDLINWTSGTVPEPNITSMGSLHRYWCEEHEVKISADLQAALKCRAITFTGQFEPVKRSCRAPLPNGNLCPRKDKTKCPFHGPIIPRDEQGKPVSETCLFETGGECSSTQLNCKNKDKKRKSKKKKYPGLTDLKKISCTPRTRIEKKILNKRALKRVGEKLDSIERKIRTDKFSNNFNYALKK